MRMKTLTTQYNSFAEKTGRIGTLWLMLLALFLFSVASDVIYGTANDTTEAVKVLLLLLIGIIGFVVFRSLLGSEDVTKPSFNKPALKTKRVKKTPVKELADSQINNISEKSISKDALDAQDLSSDDFDKKTEQQNLIASEVKLEVQEIHKESDEQAVVSQHTPSNRLMSLREEMQAVASTERAAKQREFFLQEDGNDTKEYLGVNIIDIVKISERFATDIKVSEIQTLMQSHVHDEHIVAIWLLINKYKNADQELAHTLFNFYLENRNLVNNWDMIDLASRNILGAHIQKNKNDRQSWTIQIVSP